MKTSILQQALREIKTFPLFSVSISIYRYYYEKDPKVSEKKYDTNSKNSDEMTMSVTV